VRVTLYDETPPHEELGHIKTKKQDMKGASFVGHIAEGDLNTAFFFAFHTPDFVNSPCVLLKVTRHSSSMSSHLQCFSSKQQIVTMPRKTYYKNCIQMSSSRLLVFAFDYLSVFDSDLNNIKTGEYTEEIHKYAKYLNHC